MLPTLLPTLTFHPAYCPICDDKWCKTAYAMENHQLIRYIAMKHAVYTGASINPLINRLIMMAPDGNIPLGVSRNIDTLIHEFNKYPMRKEDGTVSTQTACTICRTVGCHSHREMTRFESDQVCVHCFQTRGRCTCKDYEQRIEPTLGIFGMFVTLDGSIPAWERTRWTVNTFGWLFRRTTDANALWHEGEYVRWLAEVASKKFGKNDEPEEQLKDLARIQTMVNRKLMRTPYVLREKRDDPSQWGLFNDTPKGVLDND